eukprot:gene2050-17616_t
MSNHTNKQRNNSQSPSSLLFKVTNENKGISTCRGKNFVGLDPKVMFVNEPTHNAFPSTQQFPPNQMTERDVFQNKKFSPVIRQENSDQRVKSRILEDIKDIILACTLQACLLSMSPWPSLNTNFTLTKAKPKRDITAMESDGRPLDEMNNNERRNDREDVERADLERRHLIEHIGGELARIGDIFQEIYEQPRTEAHFQRSQDARGRRRASEQH